MEDQPNFYERREKVIKGFYCPEKRKNVSFSECLSCALSHKNTCQFDYPILSAMQKRIRKW